MPSSGLYIINNGHDVKKYKTLRYKRRKILICIMLIIHEICDKNYVVPNGYKIQNFL